MKNENPKRIIEALKEIFTFSSIEALLSIRIMSIVVFIFFTYDALKSIGEKSSGEVFTIQDILFVITIIVTIWFLGYFSRKPDPNRKGFKKWLKICKLKLQKAILKNSLKPYSTLNKIKHRKYDSIRATVKEWRLELKELESELKELI